MAKDRHGCGDCRLRVQVGEESSWSQKSFMNRVKEKGGIIGGLSEIKRCIDCKVLRELEGLTRDSAQIEG